MNSKKLAHAESTAYDGIIHLIMRGDIKPGTRLIEQQIGDELKISRTPVRSAMRSLSSEGLLENRGKGGYILPPLSLKDLSNLYLTKFMIEPSIAGYAAKVASVSKKEYFLDILDREREYYFKSVDNLYKINREIHYGIAYLTENKYMTSLQGQLFWRSELYILFFDTYYHATSEKPILNDPDLSESHKGHVEIIDAVFSNDPIRSEIAMRKHLADTWNMLKKNIISTKNSYGRMLINDWEYKLPILPY